MINLIFHRFFPLQPISMSIHFFQIDWIHSFGLCNVSSHSYFMTPSSKLPLNVQAIDLVFSWDIDNTLAACHAPLTWDNIDRVDKGFVAVSVILQKVWLCSINGGSRKRSKWR